MRSLHPSDCPHKKSEAQPGTCQFSIPAGSLSNTVSFAVPAGFRLVIEYVMRTHARVPDRLRKEVGDTTAFCRPTSSGCHKKPCLSTR